MKFKLKATLVLTFSFRLPMIALSILHLESFSSLRHSNGTQFSVTTNLLYLQIMLAWSLVSATIPNLKGFVKSFDTSFGMPAAPGTTGQSNAYPMINMSGKTTGSRQRGPRSSMRDRSQPDGLESDEEPFRPDTAPFHTNTVNDKTGDEDRYIPGNGSQEPIITKDVYYSA